jgi:hypothetical protein
MKGNGYLRPSSFANDEKYFLKRVGPASGEYYSEVEFVSYRPHPAEILIRDGKRTRVVHREDIFRKKDDHQS